MNCSLTTVNSLISAAIAALLGAIALAYWWPVAYPLFAAAALVATVSFVLLPKIRSAFLDYVNCRGRSDKCSPSLVVDTAGQVAAAISAIAFALAGALQIAAIAAFAVYFLAWIGVGLEVAVVYLVRSGMFACAIGVLLLVGVLSNVLAYKSCLDKQNPNTGPGGSTSGVNKDA